MFICGCLCTVSVCLSAWVCVSGLLALGLTAGLRLNCFMLGLFCASMCLCGHVSLSVSGCLFLSLTERAPAGTRDKSPEEVGSGWGGAGQRGGKKNRKTG